MLRGPLRDSSPSEPPEFRNIYDGDDGPHPQMTQCDLCGTVVWGWAGEDQHREWHRMNAIMADAVMASLGRRLR